MRWLKTVWSESIGLFVDDGSLAVAALAWLAASWLLLPRLGLSPVLPPTILAVGRTRRRTRQR
jgi:hypothetical protein